MSEFVEAAKQNELMYSNNLSGFNRNEGQDLEKFYLGFKTLIDDIDTGEYTRKFKDGFYMAELTGVDKSTCVVLFKDNNMYNATNTTNRCLNGSYIIKELIGSL